MHKPIVRILIAVLFSVLPSPKQVIGERRAVMPRGAAENRVALFSMRRLFRPTEQLRNMQKTKTKRSWMLPTTYNEEQVRARSCIWSQTTLGARG
jgi:hypothetical protein